MTGREAQDDREGAKGERVGAKDEREGGKRRMRGGMVDFVVGDEHQGARRSFAALRMTG